MCRKLEQKIIVGLCKYLSMAKHKSIKTAVFFGRLPPLLQRLSYVFGVCMCLYNERGQSRDNTVQ